METEAFERLLSSTSKLSWPTDQQEVVALLRETQEIFGYIPSEAQDRIAEKAGVKSAVLSVFIKRIPSLRAQPARHELVVCMGPRCAAKNSAAILKKARELLQTEPGHTDKDGRFLLTTQICMKNCGSSPNIRIDGEILSGVRPEELSNILGKYL